MPTSKILEPRVELPDLSSEARNVLSRANALAPDDITAVIAHLKENLRSTKHGESVDKAEASPIGAGDTVKIVHGALDYINSLGVVNSVGRARLRVTVEGRTTPLYLFQTDVELVRRRATTIPGKRDSSHLRAVPKATGVPDDGGSTRTGTRGLGMTSAAHAA